uniref:hypothetical protein n=1 Tax=Ramaria rubella TaxID=113071 RepID=UPI0022381581
YAQKNLLLNLSRLSERQRLTKALKNFLYFYGFLNCFYGNYFSNLNLLLFKEYFLSLLAWRYAFSKYNFLIKPVANIRRGCSALERRNQPASLVITDYMFNNFIMDLIHSEKKQST